MTKSKQFIRPQKKPKPKVAVPETADDFQEAADREEEAGGKHRAGDSTKSGRAFIRALEIYDKGLQKHPKDFDLAYNKARLQLELSQQPALVEHIGLPVVDLLQETLNSHRYALRLDAEQPDVLFNTSQVLTSLAEQLSEADLSDQAIPLLHEALELLSACLARQEMLLEQQRVDFQDMDEGGVRLDPDEQAASSSSSDTTEQTALVESPVTASDLLDTVHASLSALTTLVALDQATALQTLGDMAQSLTIKNAPAYLSLLPAEMQDSARFVVARDRAIYVTAMADAQFSYSAIDVETYLDRLSVFDISGKDLDAHTLSAEAGGRVEFVQSVLERFESSSELPTDLCWKQLTTSQDLYGRAIKLDSEDARERKPGIYSARGDLELLRFRFATLPGPQVSDNIKRSTQTLVQNAATYYRNAAQLARANGDDDLENKARQRWMIAADMGSALYGISSKQPLPFQGSFHSEVAGLLQALGEMVDEGMVTPALAQDIAERFQEAVPG